MYVENGFTLSPHIRDNMEDQIKFLLENYGIDDQRTAAWFAKRGEMLTASEIWKCFASATYASRYELIMSKLAPPKSNDGPGVGALIWGTRFEPMAKEIYSKLGGIEIKDLSCVRHPEHSYIGASPDGLIISNNERNGRLIEFKCPISRQFSDETPVPDHYYHQMQLQLECTNLQECEYVEMQFKTMYYTEWIDTPAEYKSCFVVSMTGEVTYKSVYDTTPLSDWQSSIMGENFMDYQVVYWVLANWRQKLTMRDPDWMPIHFPEMKATWEEVMKHREEGTFPKSSKEKGILTL